jgi:hypothetical protein
MPTQASAYREYRGSSAATTLQGKRFNPEIISSIIESLIYCSSRRTTRFVSVKGSRLQGEQYGEFRG